jgi:hypothetical protein
MVIINHMDLSIIITPNIIITLITIITHIIITTIINIQFIITMGNREKQSYALGGTVLFIQIYVQNRYFSEDVIAAHAKTC